MVNSGNPDTDIGIKDYNDDQRLSDLRRVERLVAFVYARDQTPKTTVMRCVESVRYPCKLGV